MSNKKFENAVKLYVFVDNLNYQSKQPITVIINRHKSIKNLIDEFAKTKFYLAEEQHWIIGKQYCFDVLIIDEIVQYATPFKKGFIAFLFIMTAEEKLSVPIYFGTFLEDLYKNVEPDDRWNQPEKNLVIVTDIVDSTKPLPLVGWKCTLCTFFNKAYLKYCDTCGNYRPQDFVEPKNYVLTKEDDLRIKRDMEIEEKALKTEAEAKKKLEKEKEENLLKFTEIYKKGITYTTTEIECPICMGDIAAGEGIVLRNCFHTICKDCFKDYLTNVDNPQVKCFDVKCVGYIDDQEMQAVLNKEEFDRYQQLSLRTAEAKTENTFHCKTPNCVAWVVFDDNVNFFQCTLCNCKNCLLCAAIHENQTCKEYQEELAIKAKNDLAAKKDLEFFENLIKTGQAMKCPGCQIMIQKKSGCDWMKCNMCKIEICWATKGPRWGPKGPGDTTGGCQCRVKGKCHPKCGNCH